MSRWAVPPEPDADEITAHTDKVSAAVARERFNGLVRRTAHRQDAVAEAAGLFAGFSGLALTDALQIERPENSWLIQNCMRTGHKVGLTAGFKTGKTTLLGNVTRSLVDNVPLFDRFPVEDMGGNVAIFDYELTETDAFEMYERLGIHKTDRVFVESLRGRGFSLANDVHAELAVNYLRQHDSAVWLLDTHARAMAGFGSENDNDDVGAFLRCVDQVAAEAGLLGVIISAHTGRFAAEVGSEHARGATKFDDDMDARWIYTKDKDQKRYFRADGRNGVGRFDEFAMKHDPLTEGLTATSLNRHDARMAEIAEEVAGIVKGWSGPKLLNRSAIYAAMSGTDNKNKKRYVDYAEHQGWITFTPGPRNSEIASPGTVTPHHFQRKLKVVRSEDK